MAVASDSETELFGVHGLELGADTYEALTRAVHGNPALARLEAAAAYTATPLDRWVS
ncbi:hypothetical protein [Mobilicoccus pelagius]|uniref:Uncharacterized protein n=1 Tax=Mobilicoccus pelagius NBRC 104925 TaxID=1089455 RepID=H5UUY1_9MICO|nr:hypothetical protein [Mobilicoccus pelagius]GAB49539.1 hypothetical protein MOPEL_130_01460 [Mobilicoccus pelagius NBRC 104925]